MMEDQAASPSRAAVAMDRPGRAALLLCFALAILAMVPTQLIRLSQDEPLPWLMADYAGRLLALCVLLALAAGRWCLRRPERLRAGLLELGLLHVGLWVGGIVLLFHATPLDDLLIRILPQSVLGEYPRPTGWLYVVDLTLGMALVAVHEELVFRKLGYHALKSVLRSELAIVIVSALIFGLYHWWRGAPGIIGATLYGLVAMPCYRLTGSIWPAIFAHFLVDYIAFI
ncbi:CPBP family intramembrane glutamic endopeptidase [Dongia mobilis]|uniref:CPBP family intramembrane glutamic endopeptidase n=1 Tax=Dongia sp. TaxID=1977262 RepID=UPI0026F125E0